MKAAPVTSSLLHGNLLESFVIHENIIAAVSIEILEGTTLNSYVLELLADVEAAFENVRVERRPFQYLYADGGDDIFMNNETFEQIPISKELVTGAAFMKEGDTVEVVSDASTETVLYAEMPVKTVLKITYTEPGLKGDTATNTLKPATVETGAEVRVPLFINEGELIEVDTRDGSYIGRVKA